MILRMDVRHVKVVMMREARMQPEYCLWSKACGREVVQFGAMVGFQDRLDAGIAD